MGIKDRDMKTTKLYLQEASILVGGAHGLLVTIVPTFGL